MLKNKCIILHLQNMFDFSFPWSLQQLIVSVLNFIPMLYMWIFFGCFRLSYLCLLTRKPMMKKTVLSVWRCFWGLRWKIGEPYRCHFTLWYGKNCWELSILLDSILQTGNSGRLSGWRVSLIAIKFDYFILNAMEKIYIVTKSQWWLIGT